MTQCAFLSYQGYGSGPSYVGPLESVSGVSGIENADSVGTYKVSNFAQVAPSGTDFTVRVNAGLFPVIPAPSGGDYGITVTVGLIGCSVDPGATPWDEDPTACQLTTDASVNMTSFATLTPWEMPRWDSPDSDKDLLEHNALTGGGGLTNFLFSGIPYDTIASPDGQDWDFRFPEWSDAGSSLRIGGFFLGFDIPLRISPAGFMWWVEALNDRFNARDGSVYSRDGVLRRGASFDAVDVPVGDVTGKDASFGNTGTHRANLFRAAIANMGQPMLLNPYPYSIDSHVDNAAASPEAAALSNMQNFYSVCGLLDRRMEFRQQLQPGLKTTYSVRVNFFEAR